MGTSNISEQKQTREKLDQALNPLKAPSKCIDAAHDAAKAAKKMDAIKAGIEKVKEAVQGKKAEEAARKASDPTEKPSERVDAAFKYGKARMKEEEHACKAEYNKDKHVCH
ncbi:unnamed protein product [Rotaria sordida]|uniref:Uncharacterized protein n=2 Tax=Rotaria sordida TaxID=392033 RepID=A0A819DRJ0_9BILA|nr:unnamed protein product [Rotaria sordida]CAF3835310.1 unnamed protein product [Rotaria sordida]CAF3868789.1 unnamed protein product [Rotaria sordida]